MSEEIKEAAPVAEAAEPVAEATPAADANILGGAEETAAKETAPADAKPEANLLDDEPKAEEKPETETPAAPTAEEIAEWAKGVKALDMGDGVKWSDELLNGMAPALMGMPKDRQEAAIRAYADFQAKQAKAAAESGDAANKARIKLCKDRFGEDLTKVAGLAKKAGARIFEKHPGIWNALKATPEFANNPDVIECLAEMGRFFADDTGRVVPKDGTGDGDGGDVLHRMYGSVKP